MIKLFTFFLLLAPLWAFADAELFNIKTDKPTYEAEEKAILVTNVLTLPVDSNLEVVIKSEVNSQEVEAIKLSDHQYISKIENVGRNTFVNFKSKYFIRDRYEALDYEKAIHESDLKIMDLFRTRRLASEEERIRIDIKIYKEEQRVAYLQNELKSLLRLVEEKVLIAQVNSTRPKNLENAFIFLSSDREDPNYHPGEALTLFGHVYLQVSDKEPVVKGTFGGNPLIVEKLVNDEFLIRSESVGTPGPKEAQIQLYLRDKVRSGKLADALSAIALERARLVQILETETDPAERLDLQNQINKLDLVKAHVESILATLEQLVETVKYKFTVESV